MKKIIIIMLLLLSISLVAADDSHVVGRISIDSNNTILEYQSGIAPLGTLTQNAINAGYSNIQERYITQYEYSIWKKYGVYPVPNITMIETLEQTRLQQQAMDTQNQTTANRIKNNYTAAMQDLDTIQNTANPTEAQQNWAIKREAAILQDILRFLKWMFFS